MSQRKSSNSPFAGLIGLVVLAIVFYLIFQIVSGIVSIIYWIGPILLLIALIMNRKVVFDYVKWLANMVKKDTPRGIIYSILSVVGYPFVGTFLFFKAFLQYKLGSNKREAKKREKVYDDYEEVVDDEDFLDLPDLDIEKQKSEDSYDDLFE